MRFPDRNTTPSSVGEAVMRIRRSSSCVIAGIPSLLLMGCVAGTPRTVASVPPDAAQTEDAPIFGNGLDVGSSVRPDTAGPLALDVAAYDGGGVVVAPYDAGNEPATHVDPPDTAPSWWPASFVPGSLPDPPNGRGNHAGSSACGNCHKSGGPAGSHVWLMGGIVYTETSSTTPVASAEIGVKTAGQFVHAYSASNGYFWLPTSAGAIDWATADIRIRTAAGEVKMSSRATSGDCQTCHTAGNRIFAKP